MKASFGLDTDLQRNPDELFIQRAKNVFRTLLWIRVFSMFPFNILPNVGYFIGLAENIVQQRQQMDSSNHKDLIQLMLDAHKVSIICVYKIISLHDITQSNPVITDTFGTRKSVL